MSNPDARHLLLAAELMAAYPAETAGLTAADVAIAWSDYSEHSWAASWMGVEDGGEVRRVMQAWRDRHVGEFDYRDLLERYARHVVACEGIHFITGFHRDNSRWEVQFTDAEWAELVRVGKLAGGLHDAD